MRFLSVAFLVLISVAGLPAQTLVAPTNAAPSATSAKPLTPAALQNTLDSLTQSNKDLLALLKQQQTVLEDIQYDRRLQSRQVQLVEERLLEAMQENGKLRAKVAQLEADALHAPAQPTVTSVTNDSGHSAKPDLVAQPDPPPPSTYLPPAPPDTPPGSKTWHRLFTLSGTDNKNSDVFHIQGTQWRVLWHNLDKPGKSYANTSALFVSAFPREDTIPQKVCSKLGTGGDTTQLGGPGNFYLKIEASGGSWELAVEDFQ